MRWSDILVLEAKKQLDGGDCFKAAPNLAEQLSLEFKHQKDDIRLVHCMCNGQGNLSGVRYCHAFVLFNDTVFDYSNGRKITLPKQIYYALGGIEEKDGEYVSYTIDEMHEQMAEHKTYGPWDLKDDGATIFMPWYRGPLNKSRKKA